ncbi:MAG: hypothetical protein ACLPN1_16630 [Dissulfurispiraceae bacterium]|jgi:hypothetical protein
MKKIIFILTVIITTLDFPLAVGIVTFIPFLASAIWIAVRFWPKEYLIQWRLVLQGLLLR